MSTPREAERLLRESDPAGALAVLRDEVRRTPADGRLRIFLAQLLCVVGEWERAVDAFTAAATLDEAAVPLAEAYRLVIRGEQQRAEVFTGRARPALPDGSPAWLHDLAAAMQTSAQTSAQTSMQTSRETSKETSAARDHQAALRRRAFDAAPTSTGRINGREFRWIADADSRLGPVVEVIVDGIYTWLPIAAVRHLAIEPPTDLRDTLWAPARLVIAGEEERSVFIPARYPGSEASAEGTIALGRRTEWHEDGDGAFRGLGQRVLVTEGDEVPFLEVRTLTVDQSISAPLGGD